MRFKERYSRRALSAVIAVALSATGAAIYFGVFTSSSVNKVVKVMPVRPIQPEYRAVGNLALYREQLPQNCLAENSANVFRSTITLEQKRTGSVLGLGLAVGKYVITVEHVLHDVGNDDVRFYRVIYRNLSYDIAVLRRTDTRKNPISFAQHIQSYSVTEKGYANRYALCYFRLVMAPVSWTDNRLEPVPMVGYRLRTPEQFRRRANSIFKSDGWWNSDMELVQGIFVSTTGGAGASGSPVFVKVSGRLQLIGFAFAGGSLAQSVTDTVFGLEIHDTKTICEVLARADILDVCARTS